MSAMTDDDRLSDRLRHLVIFLQAAVKAAEEALALAERKEQT
jgi:hypothetical protein